MSANLAPISRTPLKVLFFSEFTERFVFWGLQSVLLLYLLSSHQLSKHESYQIYGAYTALAFSMSIIGGVLADRWFGCRLLVFMGILFTFLGNTILLLHSLQSIYIGLAFIVWGAGIFLPNNPTLLGSFYYGHNDQREKDFTIFYISNNLSGLLGPVIFGLVWKTFGWHYNFLFGNLLLLFWFLSHGMFKRKLTNKFINEPNTKNNLTIPKFILCSIVGIAFIYFLFKFVTILPILISVIAIMVILYLIWHIRKNNKKEKRNLYMLLGLMLFPLIFFACELQVTGSLLVFLKYYLPITLGEYKIPANVFAALEPLGVIITSPLFAMLWGILAKKDYSLKPLTKIILGFILGAIGFYMFVWMATFHIHNKGLAIILLIFGNLFIGAGEVCVMPNIIATITKLATNELKSTLMGVLYFAISASGYIAGIIAFYSDKIPDKGFTLNSAPHAYINTYFTLAKLLLLIALGLSIIVFLSRKLYNLFS